jgi:hypothetical protein
MKAFNKIVISSLLSLAFTACGGGGGSSSDSHPALPVYSFNQVADFTNHNQCNNPNQNIGQIGIPGNTACPYQGEFNASYGGYQGYAFHYTVGVGFRIDFGWDYNDMCPEFGQRPIFQNGGFSHCTGVNPLFAQVIDDGFSHPNTGECTGDQLNPGITGCRSELRPMNAPNYNIPSGQQVNPIVVDPVVNI